MSRKRMAWVAAGIVAGGSLLLAASAILILRSAWFNDLVRARIVEIIENGSGGRVTIGSCSFDWQRLRVDLHDFTLHGTEPASKPPLLHAETVAVGIKITASLRRNVDINYLEVGAPRVYLIAGPDGGTNIPVPKVRTHSNAVDSLLDLAIGRFDVRRGVFEVESRGSFPFEAKGRNLAATLATVVPGSRYRGTLAIAPLDAAWTIDGRQVPLPFDIATSFMLSRGRIDLDSARLSTGASRVDLNGVLDDLSAPAGSFRYNARIAAADFARVVRLPRLTEGWFEVAGEGRWAGGTAVSVTGKLHAYALEYRDPSLAVRNIRAEGDLTAGASGLELKSLSISGNAGRFGRADARISRAVFESRNITIETLALAALGGSFHGGAQIRNFERFAAQGEIAGFLASRLVASYSSAPLPWDGRISGTVRADGSLVQRNRVKASAILDIAPDPGQPPVQGRVEATWDSAAELLDLGHSTLALPSSHAEFSGAVGRQLQVRVTTRDLNDLLPALGADAGALPVRLERGRARFEGTVTGPLANPLVAGDMNAAGVVYEGRTIDSLQAAVKAASNNLVLENGSLSCGGLRGQFQGSMALDNWRPGSASQIFGSANIRNGDVAELAALARVQSLPLTGTAGANARITGTIGDPLVDADFEISKGTLDEEPFDRLNGRVHASRREVNLNPAQLVAGSKRLDVTARYQPAPDPAHAGTLQFKASSNRFKLSGVRTFEKVRPGADGMAQLSAAGTLEVVPARAGAPTLRIAALDGELSLGDLELDGRPVGDARITAKSERQAVRVHLESDFAGSVLRGDGQWSLAGNNSGAATIAFSKVDFTELRTWLAPPAPDSPDRFAGTAEGEVRIEGPALDWHLAKAQLRVAKLELRPNAVQGVPRGVALHNTGPIVVNFANSTVTVESARLEGPSTDLRISGKAALTQKAPLDLRVNGRVDVAILGTFYPGVESSGAMTADATIRGSLSDPQIGGRLQLENAALSVEGVPNGVSNARGVILFTGDRATIQSLSGETGGGKITFSGFAGFGGGETIFRLHARAEGIRVRYPEGVSTVANASLNLTGTADRSMLAGSVTVLRTSFNTQSDFSSVLAKSAEPVRTRSAGPGILSGLNFDIQIDTAPDVQVESSLTQDVGMEANLRLRGTFGNPALLGRISITQGQLLFFGSRYTISQGSISFFNPVRVEPVLDVDLETKARGIEVTLNISGPLNKLNMTPRSDPPLQFNEIVALLATGQAPTSDPAQLGRQSSSQQPWQQSGASAILGSAIASPVAGRLQRFFGVSRLRIDPTLPGVVYNPQARVTLEQQVTPEITFTYITVVTSSNPQVVSMEWNFSRPWSVVAVREENGLFGLDFFFKKRFK